MARKRELSQQAGLPASGLDTLRCAFDDHGVRCTAIGTLSPATTGAGPWYCRDHAHVFLHDLGVGGKRLADWKAAKQIMDEIIK